MKKDQTDMNRRQFLQRLGAGAGSALAMMAMGPLNVLAGNKKPDDVVGGDNQVKMTYRVQHGSGEKISLLGFGMMRLPDDQEDVDRLVDYAIAHGVNYFVSSDKEHFSLFLFHFSLHSPRGLCPFQCPFYDTPGASQQR